MQGGYGALFAVMVQILLNITRVAPCPVPEVGGTILFEAANLSPVIMLVAGTGAVVSRRSEAESGVAVQTISEPEICQGAGI